MENKIKIGIVCICLNQPYWQFVQEMLWGLDTFFLKHHSIKDKYETELLLWSDIPEPEDDKFFELFRKQHAQATPEQYDQYVKDAKTFFADVRKRVKLFPTEPLEWPMPTLMSITSFFNKKKS